MFVDQCNLQGSAASMTTETKMLMQAGAIVMPAEGACMNSMTANAGGRQQGSRNLTRQAVAFLSHGNVADTLVVWVGSEVCSVCDVIEVLDAILGYHVPVAPRRSEMSMKRSLYKRHCLAALSPKSTVTYMDHADYLHKQHGEGTASIPQYIHIAVSPRV